MVKKLLFLIIGFFILSALVSVTLKLIGFAVGVAIKAIGVAIIIGLGYGIFYVVKNKMLSDGNNNKLLK